MSTRLRSENGQKGNHQRPNPDMSTGLYKCSRTEANRNDKNGIIKKFLENVERGQG